MVRKIIKIDREACNGCGLCADACHEGAIGMENGKAVLLREDYCDGLGDCLPACPAGAISFEEREAKAYDEAAVQAAKQQKTGGCPSTRSQQIRREEVAGSPSAAVAASQLAQWPVQIKLAPVRAPYFDKASLLIAADCTAYAYGDFHNRFIRGRITLIGCPKLDSVDYGEKLAQIIRENEIREILIVRMQVPCCKGLEQAVERAVENSGKRIPCRVEVIGTDGTIID